MTQTSDCTKYNPNSRTYPNINLWKNHIIANINNSIGYNRNIRPCSIYDINYNINGNEYFELNMYENKLGIGTSSRFNLTDDFKCKFNINEPYSQPGTDTKCDTLSNRSNVNNYMEELKKIKGLNVATMDNVQSILLGDLTKDEFKTHIISKNKADKIKDKKLRLFGVIFKLLEEYSKIEKIDSSLKTKLKTLIEKDDVVLIKGSNSMNLKKIIKNIMNEEIII